MKYIQRPTQGLEPAEEQERESIESKDVPIAPAIPSRAHHHAKAQDERARSLLTKSARELIQKRMPNPAPLQPILQPETEAFTRAAALRPFETTLCRTKGTKHLALNII